MMSRISNWLPIAEYFRNFLLESLEKCPNTDFFLVRIFPYRTEYRELPCKSSYSVRTWDNKDQKKFRIWTLSRGVSLI